MQVLLIIESYCYPEWKQKICRKEIYSALCVGSGYRHCTLMLRDIYV